MSTRAVTARRSSPPPRVTRQEVLASHAGFSSVLRAGSSGFTVFVVGILATPLVGAFAPAVAGTWLWAIAVISFALAGHRAVPEESAPRSGAMAALVTLGLGLPLMLLLPVVALRWTEWAVLFVSAVAVGAASGVIGRHVRGRGARHDDNY